MLKSESANFSLYQQLEAGQYLNYKCAFYITLILYHNPVKQTHKHTRIDLDI